MDRFKFRVWEIKQKKYRQRTHHEADTCINCLSGKVLFGEGIEIYGEEDDKDVTLEQCTGLKDKNGKLIYEGDIVEIFSKNRYAKGIYQIKFDCNDCEYDLFDKDDNFLYQLESGKSEYLTILGNIHENKELLDE